MAGKVSGGWEVAQTVVKYTLGTHINTLGVAALTVPVLGRWRQAGGWSSWAGQPSWSSELTVH